MGCASVDAVEIKKSNLLPPEAINSCIDRYPTIVVQKLRQKFESFCEKGNKMSHLAFLKIYSHNKLNIEMTKRLFKYFSHSYLQSIRFRPFMGKYAVLTKCDLKIFSKILFFLYKNTPEEVNSMTELQYDLFYDNQKEYFGDEIDDKIREFPITIERFISHLQKNNFKASKYQQRFILTTEQDIPFEAINKELIDCDYHDLAVGQEYYVLSTQWFYRWSFYYQQVSNPNEFQNVKSTKMLLPQEKYGTRKRAKRRESSIIIRSQLNSSSQNLADPGLIEQPDTIDFADIEGEYAGELKENLKVNNQCKIISQNLWNLLTTLHAPSQIFRRTACTKDTLEYYPKAIYFVETDEKGIVCKNEMKIVMVRVSQKIERFLYIDEKGEADPLGKSLKQDYALFTKNFNDKNWREESDLSKKIADCSIEPRFFILKTKSRIKFMDNYFRKEILEQNITIGDRVFAHFPFERSTVEGYVISLHTEEKSQKVLYKIHYIGHSFRYETQVSKEEISLPEMDGSYVNQTNKKRSQSIIKGIPNIGNTCFMNSIVQCLVATPIFDAYLSNEEFSNKKQPIIYHLAQMAKSLLKNEKALPHEFKKKIDVEMPMFSGYDQHDAQQFLNLLLDKINDELLQKPTIIQELFGGKNQSKLTCLQCRATSNVDEKMYILSLPIPEPQFNCFTMIVIPLTTSTMKKIIFRLHKNSTISDYIDAFESRLGRSKKDYIFCESNYGLVRKIRQQFSMPSYFHKKILDVGIVPSIPLQVYEKLKTTIYESMLEDKDEQIKEKFKDFQVESINLKATGNKSNAPNSQQIIQCLSQTAYWTVCKIIKNVQNSGKFTVEYLTSENEIERMKIKQKEFNESVATLGTRTGGEITFKRMVLRKYNSSSKRMDLFGSQFLVNIPRWASYNDILMIVDEHLFNLKNKQSSSSTNRNGGMRSTRKRIINKDNDYIVRLIESSKNKCIFCGTEKKNIGVEEPETKQPCCSNFQTDHPVVFSAKIKLYCIFVDWIDFTKCNSMFCSYTEMDSQSKEAEESFNDQKILLQDCIKLHQKPEKVQMKCQKCNHQYQNLQNIISHMPNILILHMKEFRYTSEGHLIKLDVRLKWQEYIDASLYSQAQSGKIYELFGFVRHSGSSQSGHYTCMAKKKHPFENKKVWVNFDDDMTDIVKVEQKNIDDAYLLFYRRVDMPTSAFVNFTDLKDFTSNSKQLGKSRVLV